MGRRKTEREKDERRHASAARAKLERVQRRVASRRRMTPMKALTPTRGIDPPEPGTQPEVSVPGANSGAKPNVRFDGLGVDIAEEPSVTVGQGADLDAR